MSEDLEIRRDRMRFSKNTLSSRLALLAIAFDVLYFISIYKSDVGTYYYNILIGGSIIYNLVFLLMTFLASEGVKNYKRGYSVLLIVLGVLQIGRIFIIPWQDHQPMVKVAGVDTVVMGDAQFIRVVIYLVLSAVCLFLSAGINSEYANDLEAKRRGMELLTEFRRGTQILVMRDKIFCANRTFSYLVKDFRIVIEPKEREGLEYIASVMTE